MKSVYFFRNSVEKIEEKIPFKIFLLIKIKLSILINLFLNGFFLVNNESAWNKDKSICKIFLRILIKLPAAKAGNFINYLIK